MGSQSLPGSDEVPVTAFVSITKCLFRTKCLPRTEHLPGSGVEFAFLMVVIVFQARVHAVIADIRISIGYQKWEGPFLRN
jgi:hypothetical protein